MDNVRLRPIDPKVLSPALESDLEPIDRGNEWRLSPLIDLLSTEGQDVRNPNPLTNSRRLCANFSGHSLKETTIRRLDDRDDTHEDRPEDVDN